MNQADLRRIAEERILDAKALLDGKRWELAYYATGYAVECALKSCVLSRMIFTGWVFEEKWQAEKCRTHDLDALISLAGLRDELNAKLQASSANGTPFVAYWPTTVQWKVSSRYEAKTEMDARKLYEAISQEPDGVLPWLRTYW